MSDEDFDVAIIPAILAIAIAHGKSAIQVNWIGNFITAIGCELLAIAAQQDCQEFEAEEKASKKKDAEMDLLKKQVQKLEMEIQKLKMGK